MIEKTMINPKTLSRNDVGRKVVYTDFGRTQEGILSSWNDTTVWVRFKGPCGEACDPKDLEFAAHERR